MKKPLFLGACTALVTTFAQGKVNFPLLKLLVQRQVEAGIHAFVLCGTTGESPTLSDQEKIAIFRYVRREFPEELLICGTGSNDTRHAAALSRAAEDAGADALLVVSPYYNKATASGLVDHYRTIAGAVQIPLILYNVPGRTGVDMPVSVYRDLAALPNIAGVKEASTDIRKIADILTSCPRDFQVWSGNDDMTVPIMSLGGSGVISVASNVVPLEMQELCLAALDGDFDTAAALQMALLPLINALFREVNPIPVKGAMEVLGYDCGAPRLPLTQAREETMAELRKVMGC